MNILNNLSLFWQGKLKLWQSYWIIGELLNAIVVILILNYEIKYHDNMKLIQDMPILHFSNLQASSKFIIFFWTVFITIGIWRSAERYKGKFIWIVLTLIILSFRIFTLRGMI